MPKKRPSPLSGNITSYSAPPTFDGCDDCEDLPVKNTFIDIGGGCADTGRPLVTAPAKFVGRLAGAFPEPEQQQGVAAAQQQPVMAVPVGRAMTLPVAMPPCGPPPSVAPAFVPAPPMQSPHLPPGFSFTTGTATQPPPPPLVSPAGLGHFAPAQPPTVLRYVPQAGPPCAPPPYAVNIMNSPEAACPPPMHTPICATPVPASLGRIGWNGEGPPNRFFAPGGFPGNSRPTQTLPPPASQPSSSFGVPPTPKVMWPATPF
eukprot:NODE_10484_length_1348_cov_3.135954.p2 GENE.NODE_10484_length_1348_cov_3.135954~~NODE_10484_length_1348_cov_3.135954.p2  ORF type:complete len:260 (-),score=73.73 NODE_10484_length_1348_cov_3.135954:425-1204(-)